MPTTTLLPALAVAALAAGGWSPVAPAQGSFVPKDPVERLERWMDGFRRGPDGYLAETRDELADLVEAARAAASGERGDRERALVALLDLAGIRRRAERPPEEGSPPDLSPATRRVRSLGALEVDRLLDRHGELVRWICDRVLALPGGNGLDRRVAALEALGGRRRPPALPALFSCVRDAEREVRRAALGALVGWPNERVHLFMAARLAAAWEGPDQDDSDIVRAHFEGVWLDAASPARGRLRGVCAAGMASHAWRRASRMIELLAVLDDQLAVPVLIEGLSLWVGRREAGLGSMRIEGDLVGQLRGRSGLTIGARPERWLTWWNGVRAGHRRPREQGPDAPVTRVSFFGLRPMTDRLVFVIDRSGSMSNRFGTGESSRYEEAVRQMIALLESMGEQTRFRVVLFDGGTEVWGSELRPATPGNLQGARRWLQARRPAGGTYLQPAILEAMRVGRSGRLDLERLEADTVLVLCDGEVTEGKSWVAPLLEAVNDEACLRFHCVQIGAGGNGTLELLAELTGGEFVRAVH